MIYEVHAAMWCPINHRHHNIYLCAAVLINRNKINSTGASSAFETGHMVLFRHHPHNAMLADLQIPEPGQASKNMHLFIDACQS